MERWIPTALASLALAIGVFNAWSLSDLSARLDASEWVPVGATVESRDVGPRTAGRASAREPRFSRSVAESFRVGEGPPGGAAAAPGDDETAFQERVASVMAAEEERRDAERRARFEESVQAEVEAFADEEGLDDATTKALLALISTRSEAFGAIRREMHDGTLSWTEGRAEMEALREEGDAEAERLLGADRADRLEARLWGDRGGPPGRGR